MLRLGVFILGLLGCIVLTVFLGPQLFGKGAASPYVVATRTPVPFTPTPPPTLTPTPQCVESKLALGTNTYRIKTIPNGSLAVPADTPDTAYWVENTHYVFALSPAASNQTLETTLKNGDIATIFWADCSATSFTISAIEAAQLSDLKLLEQSEAGMIAFVQTDSSGAGFVIRGGELEPVVIVTDTPLPAGTQVVEAEISLLETSTSADKTTIKVGVSIFNYGASAFTVSASDVSLMPENAAPLAPASAEPALPREIKPGATETIYFTFPRPASPTAVFNILGIEYDLEGF
jgi:hypothetical protein